MDTRLAAMAVTLPQESPGRKETALETAGTSRRAPRGRARGLARARTPPAPVEMAPAAVARASWAPARATPGEEAVAVAELVDEKLEVAEEVLTTAVGMAADAVADRETRVPGEELVDEALAGAGPAAGDSGGGGAGECRWIGREAGRSRAGSGGDAASGPPRPEAMGYMTPSALYQVHFAGGCRHAEPTAPYFLDARSRAIDDLERRAARGAR